MVLVGGGERACRDSGVEASPFPHGLFADNTHERREGRTKNNAANPRMLSAVHERSVLSERSVSRQRNSGAFDRQRGRNSPTPGGFKSRSRAGCARERDSAFKSADKSEQREHAESFKTTDLEGPGHHTLLMGACVNLASKGQSGKPDCRSQHEGVGVCINAQREARSGAVEERFSRKPAICRTRTLERERRDRTGDFSDRRKIAVQQGEKDILFSDRSLAAKALAQAASERRFGKETNFCPVGSTGGGQRTDMGGSGEPGHGAGTVNSGDIVSPFRSHEPKGAAGTAQYSSGASRRCMSASEISCTLRETQRVRERGGEHGGVSYGGRLLSPGRSAFRVGGLSELCLGWGTEDGRREPTVGSGRQELRLGETTESGEVLSSGGLRQVALADSCRVSPASFRGGEHDAVFSGYGGERSVGDGGARGTASSRHFNAATSPDLQCSDVHPDEVLFFRGNSDLEDTSSLFTWTRQWRAYEEEEDAAAQEASHLLSDEIGRFSGRSSLYSSADQARLYPPRRYGFYSLVRHEQNDSRPTNNAGGRLGSLHSSANIHENSRVMRDNGGNSSAHNRDGEGLLRGGPRGGMGDTREVLVPDVSAVGRAGTVAPSNTEGAHALTDCQSEGVAPARDQEVACVQQVERGTEGETSVAQQDRSSPVSRGQEEAVPVESPVRRPARRSYAEVVSAGPSTSGAIFLQGTRTATEQDGEAGELDDHGRSAVAQVDLAGSRSRRRHPRFSSSVSATEMYTFLQLLLECLASYTPSAHIRPPRLRRRYRGDGTSGATSFESDSSSLLDDDDNERSHDEEEVAGEGRRRDSFVSSFFFVPRRTSFAEGDFRNGRSSTSSSDSRRRRRRQEDLRRVVGVSRSVHAPLEALIHHTRTLLGRWRRLLAVKRRHTRERMEAEEAEARVDGSFCFANGSGRPLVDGAVRQRWRRHEARCEREEANLREKSIGLMEFWSFLRGCSEGE